MKLLDRFRHLENVIHHRLVLHSVTGLRIVVGAVFLGFGVLKYFPGVSPAENLTKATTDLLTFGLVPGGVSIVAIATLECFIGICLLAGRWMRVAIWLLALEFIGILSELCERHHVSESTFYEWRDVSLGGATGALEREEAKVPV